MDAKHEEVIRKVQKLFRLAEKAGTDAEAQAAAIRAREIMAQYNISLSDTKNFKEDDCQESEVVIKKNYIPRYCFVLSVAMEALFGVKTLRGCKYDDEKPIIRRTYIFIGVGADSIVASQTFSFLLECAMRNARKLHLTGKNKTDFLYGFARAIHDRAMQEKKKVVEKPQENALVPVKSQAIAAYVSRKYPVLGTCNSHYNHGFSDSVRAGYAAGEKAPLSRPVEESVKGNRIALN